MKNLSREQLRNLKGGNDPEGPQEPWDDSYAGAGGGVCGNDRVAHCTWGSGWCGNAGWGGCAANATNCAVYCVRSNNSTYWP